jgi:integrase
MPPEVLWTGLTIVKCAAGYNSSPSCDGSRVFQISTGFKTAWGHILKRPKIASFRWHDLRHHFASRLVQRGVPLNTVRDLLGHSSVAILLRYAHLAPDQRREAVAISQKPILALTLRLPSNAEVARPSITF